MRGEAISSKVAKRLQTSLQKSPSEADSDRDVCSGLLTFLKSGSILIRILNFFFRGAPLVYGFYGTTMCEKTDSGACRGSFFHGKSSSGSKFQYIIFKYRCHDIG